MYAQKGTTSEGKIHNLELTLNIDRDLVVPSIAYQQYFTFGAFENFLIGPGLRIFGISSGSNWRFAESNAPEDNFKDGDPNVNAFIADETRIATVRFEHWKIGFRGV
jgi:hypothetical protein